MSTPADTPSTATRWRMASVAGWALAALGGVAAVAGCRAVADPAVPLAGLTVAVIVGASLLSGSLAGLAAAAWVPTLAWLWLDAAEPLPSGYELGLGFGGALLALAVGAVVQLRGFEAQRAGWRARLDRLTEELLAISFDEDPVPALGRAAQRATDARSVRVVPPGAPRSAGPLPDGLTEVSSRAVPALLLQLELPDEPPAILAADFASFLRSIADQCAQALQRVELVRAEQRASADLELLAKASAALSASIEVDRVLDTINALIVPSLADEVSVVVAPRVGERRRRGSGHPPDDDQTWTIELNAHGAVVGHLTVRRDTVPLSDRDRESVALLAEPIGRALDHSLLYAEQVHTSSMLEHSLLPEAILPVSGLDVATRYLAAAEGHAAGGDFFDVLVTPQGTAVLIVGDVQGKGVEAATLTSAARHTLRAAALTGAGPSAMLEHLNRSLLYAQSERVVATVGDPSIRFVTAAVVALHPTPQGFRALVASGGHPPPIVIRPSGTVEQARADGVLLGVFPDACYHETAVELGLADIVVLYTDGVTEQRAHPDLFNEAHLGRLVRNMRTARTVDADAAAQLILDTVVGLNPREVRDDIALVVARVTGPR